MNYTSHIHWQRNNIPFTAKTYDRTHQISFGAANNSTVNASSAPEFMGKAELVNPEELFTASISSCLMLTFLYIAAMKNIVIEDYKAETIGTLAKNAEGKMAVTEVVIKPVVSFGEGTQPDAATLQDIFKKAHDQCFISSSVKTTVKIELT